MSNLGVIIPTRNCRAELPEHLRTMAAWSDLVDQLVVVDSYSEDGTLQYFRKHLKHPRLSILSHPPGLYASWNYGISRLQTRFTYVSTIGDTITRQGLLELLQTADRLQTDVLVSPPQFYTQEGTIDSRKQWPIHRMIEELEITEPRVLLPMQTFLYAAVSAIRFGLNSILGSSASNIYRTEVLQKHPFPTHFGHAGDTAWGVEQAFDLNFGIHPHCCSTFLLHGPKVKTTPADFNLFVKRLAAVATDRLQWEVARRPDSRLSRVETLAKELLESLLLGDSYREQLDRLRRRAVPWALNPRAWVIRHQRNRLRRRCRNLGWRITRALTSPQVTAQLAAQPRVAARCPALEI